MRDGWELSTLSAIGDDALVQRARRVIPGGSLTRSKACFGRYAASADGSIVIDTHGRQYIDTLAALGAATLGNRAGAVYSLPHQWEAEAAESVLQHVTPWASWVRFCKTGSESTHGAYRIAKASTGVRNVIAFEGAYHGWFETWDEHVIRVPYHLDPEQWPVVPESIAAVFVEPLRFGHMSRRWLQGIRKWCDRHGNLLVFDSMVYGGRFAVGGTSEYCGVIPDMETFGKALGGGAAVSFIVGRERTKRSGDIPSGTFSGSVDGLRGVCETLAVYATQPVIATLWERGRQLLAGLKDAIPASVGVVEGHPVCHRIAFVSPAMGQAFCDAMLANGVILHPNVVLVMYSHAPEQIDQVIAAAKQSVEALA